MSILAPRYKRYAAWPIVIWCRLRRHAETGRFWSGTQSRCVECGDRIIPPEAIGSMQRNIDYWGERCCKVEAKNARLRTALADLIEINRRDESTDPDQVATDSWREQAWENAREALR
jgi:hypothetical protein